jgi:hypothetical protein
VREINVSRAGDPVHAGDKALTWETPARAINTQLDLWTCYKYTTGPTDVL